MEDQENSIREENFIQNETEKFFETDEEFEKNEILSNFSGSHILNTSKNNGEKASLNQNDNVLDESNLTKELQVQEISSKNEMKNIEILDLNQQASDDIDRPFLFASQQSLKLDNQHFNNSKLDDSPKENSLEKETFDREKFSLNNKNKEVVGLNSGKLTKSAVKYDHTELKLRKTILTYQRHSSKFQFKTVSDQGKSIDRLSCLPIRKIEHYNVKTIHDKLKGVDVDALSSRLYNSKIRKLFLFN